MSAGAAAGSRWGSAVPWSDGIEEAEARMLRVWNERQVAARRGT